MKKYAPAVAIVGLIIIGILAFSLTRETSDMEALGDAPATTTGAGTSTASTPGLGAGPVGVTAPIKKVVKAYANPSWDIRFRYEMEWQLSQNEELVSIESPSASFMISKEQPIAEPARLTSTTKTRTILGEEVEVTRFDNPRPEYAYYEYFTLRVNKTEYYFKITSVAENNPKVEEFIAGITAQ